MRYAPAFATFLFLFAMTPFPRPGWCGLDEMRALMADLERSRNELGSLSLGWPARDDLPVLLAKAPPEPGWRDVEFPSGPAYRQVSGLLELLEAARELGFLDRQDATSRQVLWEIAGRARLSRAECEEWNARFRRLAGPVSGQDHVRAVLDRLDGSVAQADAVVELARKKIESEVLAGGPPPKGRPLLAERSEAYHHLLKRLDALDARARELNQRQGSAVQHDWPARIEAVLAWARWREDVLGMIKAAGLGQDSPRPALEFADFFTDNDGWSFEGIQESVCRPFDWKPQIPELEQRIAHDACQVIDSFFAANYGPNYDLNAKVRGFLGRE